MKLLTFIFVACACISFTSVSSAQIDPMFKPISPETLYLRILKTPIASPEHRDLLTISSNIGAAKTAYTAYLRFYQKQPNNACANLWHAISIQKLATEDMINNRRTVLDTPDSTKKYREAHAELNRFQQSIPPDHWLRKYAQYIESDVRAHERL